MTIQTLPEGTTMKQPLLPAALLVGAVVVAGAGGAVAGSMITGAQIKDGTITLKDIAPGTRDQLTGVFGMTRVRRDSGSVADGENGVVTAKCPPGREVLGATGFWGNQHTVAEVYPVNATSASSYAAFSTNVSGSADTLYLTIVCAYRG